MSAENTQLQSEEKIDKPTSLVAESAIFTGNMTLTEGIKVAGTVIGDIKITGENAPFFLDATGKVEGNVSAKIAIIAGTIKGAVHADRIVLQKTSTIEGEITYSFLQVTEGATIMGKVQKQTRNSQPKPVENISRFPMNVSSPS